MHELYERMLDLPVHHSFFLFGARGVGKSTLLRKKFSNEFCLWIDLLKPAVEDRYARSPDLLYADIEAKLPNLQCVVIDEVQKLPRLLDIVHDVIETKNIIFILTGSSARKLKQGGANLLAGRAFVKTLFPLSYLEQTGVFNLEHALSFGALPKVMNLKQTEDKFEFLQSYVYTYLKEEILAEQLVRKIEPFRRFLEVAAQSNGKVIHYEKIGRDCGVDGKTVAAYFGILEDTWLGMLLEPFEHSFRKRLCQKPKFYFYDLGVTRALSRLLTLPIRAGTSYYGELFESFVIMEIAKLVTYFHPEYRLSYLMTKEGLEIDLVVERPGEKLLLIEIKSTAELRPDMIQTLLRTSNVLNAEGLCLSQDPHEMRFDAVVALPWEVGVSRYFQSFKNKTRNP